MLSLIFSLAHAATPENAWGGIPTFYMSPSISSTYTVPMDGVIDDLWNIPVSFFGVLATDDDFSVSLGNGESEIAFTSSLALLCGTGADGCCWVVNDASGVRTEADIYMDSLASWSVGTSKTNTWAYGGGLRPFRTTFLHEIGHAYGLGHEDSVLNVMGQDYTYVSTNGTSMDVRLGEDANTGLASLYGGWPDIHDVRVMHWRFDFANGPYSWHDRTRLFNSIGGEMPFTIPVSAAGNGDPGEKLYQVNSGQALSLEYTFENLGSVPFSTVDFQVYLSTNNYISTTDTLLTSGVFYNLQPNTPYTGTFGVTIPTNLVRGDDYWLGIMLDSSGAIAEHDESNNLAYLASFVIP